MGITAEELKVNFPMDERLHEEIASTCNLVRDYSIKELATINKQTISSLKDICYGTGYVMFEGKMYSTGACTKAKSAEPKPLPTTSDSTDIKIPAGICELKKTEFLIAKPRVTVSPFNPRSLNERLEILDSVELGGLKKTAFIQKNVNSNLEIPS